MKNWSSSSKITYMLITKIRWFVFLLAVYLLSACNPSQVNNSPADVRENKKQLKIPESNGNFVSSKLARYTAGQFANTYDFSLDNFFKGKIVTEKSKKKRNNKKKVKNVLKLRGSSGKTALYLINYTRGGFVIIPGDKGESPILAYSEFNSLPTVKEQNVPGGFAVWIDKRI